MSTVQTKETVIALLGQPNSGKSTLFNGLTGLRQHVGNWPGKTVEQKEGYFTRGGVKYTVADLPGTYSLSANSDEEIITRDYIAGGKADVVVILADASQLERSLFMLADFAGIETPAVLLLNLMDVAQEQGKIVDAQVLEKKLGIPVVPFSATDVKHYDGFYTALDRALSERKTLRTDALSERYRKLEGFTQLEAMMPTQGMGDYAPLWLAAKVMEGDAPVTARVEELLAKEDRAKFRQLAGAVKDGALHTGQCKFDWIDSLLDRAVSGKKRFEGLSKFDRLATSKRWGKPLAVAIILLGLIASFIPAAPFMIVGGMLPSLLTPGLTAGLSAIGAPQFIIGLICDVGVNALYFAISMIGFVFGITLVFGFIEEIGYMARISYVFDNTMAKLGLQGKVALEEDISSEDVTTCAVIESDRRAKADLLCKQDGVIAGLSVFERVFQILDPEAEVEFHCQDGDAVTKGQLLAVVSGNAHAILSGERTALNYLQRMSGIATYTKQTVSLLEGSSIRLLDTRKTTPNMRIFEKYAVKVGGGYNHRYNLSDGVLLKDNHINAAGGVAAAVKAAQEYAPFVRKIEVETENLDMVKEAVEAGADIIMLDNMTAEDMKEAVKITAGRAKTECSGNVTRENIEKLKEIGVDYISCGALTHSAPILDVSLKNFFPYPL